MVGFGNVMFRGGMKVQGRPLLRLTTVGSHSGKERRRVVCWFPDGERDDSWIIVASNGGARRHPAWAYNLARHPDGASVEPDAGESVNVTSELISGPERVDAWSRIIALAPGFQVYTTKTDRQLPVFRLAAR